MQQEQRFVKIESNGSASWRRQPAGAFGVSLVVPQKVAQTGEDVAVVVEVDHGASQAVLQRPAVELEEPQHRAPDPGSEPRPHGEVRLINVASLHGQFRERHHDPRKQVEDNLCSRKQGHPLEINASCDTLLTDPASVHQRSSENSLRQDINN